MLLLNNNNENTNNSCYSLGEAPLYYAQEYQSCSILPGCINLIILELKHSVFLDVYINVEIAVCNYLLNNYNNNK